MSLIKSATRRLSLLAGSSLVAASLSATVSVAVTLVPATAAAQTCTPADPPAVNPGADSYTCSGTPHAAGITYTSAGSPLTLTTTTSGMDIGPAGINLTGTGSDSITFNSAVEVDGAGIVGPMLEMRTASGAININGTGTSGLFLDADDSNSALMTHGVLAESTSGTINIDITRSIDAENAAATGAVAAIEARTGGAGAINITTGQNLQGRLYGILAATSGSGAVTINLGNSPNASASTGVGLHVTTGTGLLTINGSASGGHTGIYINAGGDVEFTGGGTGGSYGVYFEDISAGTTTTVNNTTGGLSGSLAGLFARGDGELIVNVTGSADIDVTGMTQTAIITSSANRMLGLGGNMVRGNYELTITADSGGRGGGSELTGSANLNIVEPPMIATFSGADSVFINEGVIVVGATTTAGQLLSGRRVGFETELQMVGLGEFRNVGRILLGGGGTSTVDEPGVVLNGVVINRTDEWYDDVLSMPGARWVGDGGEVWMDIDPGRSQTDCTTRNAEGDLGAADCLRIVGGSTQGTTYLRLFEQVPGDRGRLNEEGIVLVDVAGGTGGQGDFVISPNTPGYNPEFGGILDKGVFQYIIAYNEDRQQHILYGLPSGNAHQMPMLATAAQDLWRTSTASWLERQAGLREDGGLGGGIWVRGRAEQADRDIVHGEVAGGQTFAFDNTHEQKAYAITAGADLVGGMDGDRAFVAGLMLGYAHADIEYDVSPNEQAMDAWTAGAYASIMAGGLYLDTAINANNVILDNDTPGFNFAPAGTILSSRLISVGGEAQAGWRLPLQAGFFVEPAANLSYVKSSFDDLVIRPDDPNRLGLTVSYDDPTSFRGALGGLIGWEQDLGYMRTRVSLLGRVWNEFEGENAAIIHNDAYPTDPNLILTDDFSGQFNEVAVGAKVYSSDGTVSGFLNFGGMFGDDYTSQNLSAGVRVNW